MNGVNQDLPIDAIAALERGSKIEAIKCVRIARVSASRRPRISSSNSSSEARRSSIVWLRPMRKVRGTSLAGFILIAAIGAVAYYFLVGKH